MILGISGKLNSGKDTVGKIIQIISNSPHFTDEAVSSFLKKPVLLSDWQIKKFADKLKDMVCMMLNCTREQLEDREFKEKELGEEWWLVKSGGTPAKSYLSVKNKTYNALNDNLIKLTPRLLLQLLGTECGRQILHPNIWVNSLMSSYTLSEILPNKDLSILDYRPKYNYPNWIITDMRFPNELDAVKKKEGVTIRVNRDYILTGGPENPKNQHESETALDNIEFDYTINNDGTLLELITKVREILKIEKLWGEKQ